MTYSPEIPSHKISAALYYWVLRGIDKVDDNELKLLADWYRSLGIKHDYSKLYYRGLSISNVGFSEFAKSGQLKLKPRLAESWSCHKSVAHEFSEVNVLDHVTNHSIMLGMKIKEKDVLFDLDGIAKLYEKVDVDKLPINFNSALQKIKKYEECELVTKTLCTRCSVDTSIVAIAFRYDGIYSYENLEILFTDHLNLKDWYSDILNKYGMYKKNSVVSIHRKGRKWVVKFKYS